MGAPHDELPDPVGVFLAWACGGAPATTVAAPAMLLPLPIMLWLAAAAAAAAAADDEDDDEGMYTDDSRL